MSPTPAQVADSREVARLNDPGPQAAPIVLGHGILIVPLVQLQSDLEPFEVNLADIEGQVERAVIADQTAYQGGSDILSAIQSQLGQLEAKRVEVKKPADDFGTMVQKLVKPIKERLEAAKQTLNAKMLVWYRAEEDRKRKAQEEIRKQQQAEADALAAKARAQGQESTAKAIEDMVAAAPAAPPPKVGIANYAGKTHAPRVYWNGSVHDPMEILRNVVAGKLPIHIVEFSKSGMNAVATEFIKSLNFKSPEDFRQEHMLHLGIKIEKSEKLV